jgi:hypothetical protein
MCLLCMSVHPLTCLLDAPRGEEYAGERTVMMCMMYGDYINVSVILTCVLLPSHASTR